MAVGELVGLGENMSEHQGMQFRQELADIMPAEQDDAVLIGKRQRALNFLVGSALSGLYAPDKLRELAAGGTEHVLDFQDENLVKSALPGAIRQ